MTHLHHNNNRQPQEEPEEAYALMMEALDGDLDQTGWGRLADRLAADPALGREWEAWQAVDSLFRATPMLQPAMDFTQRTLSRLPDSRQRLQVMTALYGVLLLAGAVPVIAMATFLVGYLPSVAPAGGLLSIVGQALGVAAVVVRALLSGAADFIKAYPYTLGWLFVMAGLVFLWNGVYQRMVLEPQRSAS